MLDFLVFALCMTAMLAPSYKLTSWLKKWDEAYQEKPFFQGMVKGWGWGVYAIYLLLIVFGLPFLMGAMLGDRSAGAAGGFLVLIIFAIAGFPWFELMASGGYFDGDKPMVLVGIFLIALNANIAGALIGGWKYFFRPRRAK